MMSDTWSQSKNKWKETILDEFVDSISETFKFNSESVVFLNTSDILAGKILHNNTSDPKTLPGQAKKRIKKGDFLFSEIRPINKRYARITFDAENYVVSTKLMVLRSKGEIEPVYLEYFLTSDETLEYLQMIAEDRSGTFPQITFDIIKRLEISLPPLEEQNAIAEVLSSLDDKIDLLQRQNQTLEQMAETLFRQWFVEEADEDWELGSLDDVLTVKGGTTPSTKNPDYWNGDIHWTSPRDITTLNSIYLFDTERKITEAGLKKVSSGLLPKGTLLMSSRAPVGVLAFAEVSLAINQGYIAILDNKGFSKEYLFLWLKTNMDYVLSYANGSTFLEISKSAFRSLEIQIPPTRIRDDFQEKIAPLFNKIKSNQTQIRTLTSLRDSLLPKLMSGEVRVM